jgi:serine/threonine protein kinase
MLLTSGTRLGPYEVQSPLGAGGMGGVYRAKDTRLDRTVAVKILPDHLSDNPDAKQRFPALKPLGGGQSNPQEVILNWTGTLKQ